jgi:hypothetical protein
MARVNPFVDHGAGAIVRAGQHVSVDTQCEGWVAVAEVLGQFLDGDAPSEHDTGEVVAELVEAFLASRHVAAASAPVGGGLGGSAPP